MTPTPYWNRSFRRHDPLTHRFARTLSEAFPKTDDDGLEGPLASDRRARRRANHPLLWALSMLLICVMLTSPKWWPALFGG